MKTKNKIGRPRAKVNLVRYQKRKKQYWEHYAKFFGLHCGMCRKPFQVNEAGRYVFCVDHDHATGKSSWPSLHSMQYLLGIHRKPRRPYRPSVWLSQERPKGALGQVEKDPHRFTARFGGTALEGTRCQRYCLRRRLPRSFPTVRSRSRPRLTTIPAYTTVYIGFSVLAGALKAPRINNLRGGPNGFSITPFSRVEKAKVKENK
jgi:hypothetical protein